MGKKLEVDIHDAFGDNGWYEKRYDAIAAVISGDIKTAFECEKEALKAAKDENCPEWLINNILIDCRNLELYKDWPKSAFTIGGDYQQKLDKSQTIISLPTVDRYLCDIYSNVAENQLRERTDSPYTIRYGSNFDRVIKACVSYYYSVLVLGSYTHMRVARQIFIYVLESYGELYEINRFLFESFRLRILDDDTKYLDKIYRSYKDELYPYVASKASELINLADNTFVIKKLITKLEIIRLAGMYTSDEEFKNVESYLHEALEQINTFNGNDFLKALGSCCKRMDVNDVLSMITSVINRKNFTVGSNVTNILFDLDLKGAKEDTLRDLDKALLDSMKIIMERGGESQVISVLVGENEKIFSNLIDAPDNGLSDEFRKELFQVNIGKGSWLNVVKKWRFCSLGG